MKRKYRRNDRQYQKIGLWRRKGETFWYQNLRRVWNRSSDYCQLKVTSWLFPNKSNLLWHQFISSESHEQKEVMFAEEWIFQAEPTNVTLLSKSMYKVFLKCGVKAHQLEPETCLLVTGAGLWLGSKAFPKKEWLTSIIEQQSPPLRIATKKPISLGGTILLFIRIGDFIVHIGLQTVETLAV